MIYQQIFNIKFIIANIKMDCKNINNNILAMILIIYQQLYSMKVIKIDKEINYSY